MAAAVDFGGLYEIVKMHFGEMEWSCRVNWLFGVRIKINYKVESGEKGLTW